MKALTLAAVLLLLFGLAGLIKQHSRRVPAPGSGERALALEVQLPRLTIRKSGGHAQVSLTAVFRQNGRNPLPLTPPLVTLLTARHTAAPRYLGPMLPEPVLNGPGPAPVTLHYWLPSADLEGPLVLEAAGKTYPLKRPELPESTPD